MIYGLWINVAGYIALLYTASSMLGYLVYERIVGHRLSEKPFFVRFPIYVALGILILIPLTFVIGLFAVTNITLLCTFVILVILFARKLVKGKLGQFSLHIALKEEVLPFLLFVFTSVYFIYVIGKKLWPPPGDIMSSIGPLVSLIEFNGRLPFSPNPFLTLYPPGFQIITATFNSMWGLYPGQAVFVFGGSIAILIPLVVYSLTYFITDSKPLSLMAFSCTFISDPVNLERWIMGYFYNGPYPCMTGFLMLVTFGTVVTMLRLDLSTISGRQLRGFFEISLLSFSALLVTYPPFAIPVVICLMIMAIHSRKRICNVILKYLKAIASSRIKSVTTLIITVALALTLGFCIYLMKNELEVLFGYIIATYNPPGMRTYSLNFTSEDYKISTSYLFSSVTGISFLAGIPIAVGAVIKRKSFGIASLYLVTGIPVLLSLNNTLFRWFVVILPNRILVLLSLFSWVLMFSTIGLLLQKVGNWFGTRKSKSTPFLIVIMLLSLLLSSYLLFPYASGQLNEEWSWFSISKDDFAAIEWVNKNVSTGDLILNDASFTSEFELSMSVKNMTFWVWTWVNLPERTNALLEVWKEPSNVSMVITLLRQYNVSYILSTSEWGQLLYQPDLFYNYVSKPYTPQQYATIFDQYSFLKAVFRQGSTVIYKVIYVST